MNAQGRFAIGWSTLLSSVSGKYLRLQQGPVYMRRYGSDGAPLALAQKVSDRQSGIAEVPLDPGALVPLYAAPPAQLRYAAMPPHTSIDASGAPIVPLTAGLKLTPYLGLGSASSPVPLRGQQG